MQTSLVGKIVEIDSICISLAQERYGVTGPLEARVYAAFVSASGDLNLTVQPFRVPPRYYSQGPTNFDCRMVTVRATDCFVVEPVASGYREEGSAE